MNNINIKSKKTRTLNKVRFLQIVDRYDPFYANIYCVMASKRTNKLSKNELKRDLASLYDARLTVTQSIDNNVINLRYTISSIIDQYLPTPASSDVDQLFAQVLEPIEFTDEEIISSSRELSLYIKNYYDNKQNIATSKLNEIIDFTGTRLTVEEIIEFYNNPDIAGTKQFIKTIFNSEMIGLNFNDGEASFEQQYTNLDYQIKDYKPAADQTIEMDLDQTYVAIGYKLAGTDVTLNNIVNMIFGGGVYSKLFKNVREELSLSYNIRSSLSSERLITVTGGINNQKVELALAEIDRQLEILKQGDLESELELAKTNYIESLKRNKSNEMSYISLYGTNYLNNSNRTHDSIISEIEQIEVQAVIEAFNKIERLATVLVK